MKLSTPLLHYLLLVWLSGVASSLTYAHPLSYHTSPPRHVSQQRAITGQITDENSESLPGVNVLVKNTTLGTVTDMDGNYRLNVPDDAETLVFSSIGYTTQEVSLDNRTVVDVQLVPDQTELDEIVVVGYGSQKKVNLTGAVGVIESKQFESRPVTNVTQSLQGQVPGLLVNQTGGQPGDENFVLKIRGNSTFSDNDPLVIVDGVTMSLNSLNPHDIESVSVLKDAASTAIYGARASGGVVLVTTKSGKAGKVRVSYDGYVGFQEATTLPETVNAYDHVTLFTEGEFNNNPNTTTFKYSEEEIEKYRTGEYPSNDRINYLFRRALQMNHNLSVSGGSESNQYYLSVGYLDQEGIVRNTSSDRINIRLKNDMKINDRLDINVNAQYTPTRVHGPSEASYPSGPSRSLESIIYDGAYRFGQDEGIRNSDGSWSSVSNFANRLGLGSEDGGFQERAFNRFSGVFAANYKITSNLTLNAQYGTKIDNTHQVDFSKRMQFINPRDLTDVDFDYDINSLRVQNQNEKQHNLQFLANYSTAFNEIHELKALVGYTQEWNTYNENEVGRTNFIADDIYVIDAGSSDPVNWSTGGTASEWAIRSVFGRLNYVLNEKYLLEANVRYDGSSRFSADKRWGIFPSVSAGWRLSEEAFMKNISWIDNMKIRASWGQVGNQTWGRVGDRDYDLYQYYSTIANSAYYFNGLAQTATYYDRTANRDLRWETKTTTNLGLDVGLFKNKLGLVVDVFEDITSDILMVPSVPTTFGRSAPAQNVATIQNRGWESQLSYRDNLGDFSYGLTVQISDYQNKIISMINSPQIDGEKISEEGYELKEWFGYRALGIFSSQEELDAYPARLNPDTGIGDLIIEDFNGDGEINADDRQRMGSSLPRLPYGFSMNLGWKNLDFSAFFQGVAYRKTYLTRVASLPFRSPIETAQVRHLDRWRLDDDGTTWIPGQFPKTRISSFNNEFSSFWLQDAAYLRLKNIQLGYSLPTAVLERLRLQRLRVYVSGENLLTFSKIYGFDPESPDGQGNYYPLSRVVNAGINLTF